MVTISEFREYDDMAAKVNYTNYSSLTETSYTSRQDVQSSTDERYRWTDPISYPEVNDLDAILAIPSRIATFPWASDDVSGTLLFSCPVTPGYCARDDIVVPNNDVRHRTTNLAHFAVTSRYWRGSLNYTVEIIASRFQQGKLYAVYVPGFTVNPPYNAARALGGKIIDIGIENRIEIEVPFNSESDFLNTLNISGFNTNLPGDTPNTDSCHGTFNVYVLNPMVPINPESASPIVDVNVDIKAGKDFAFSVLRPLPVNFAFESNGRRINVPVAILNNAFAEPVPPAAIIASQPPHQPPIDPGSFFHEVDGRDVDAGLNTLLSLIPSTSAYAFLRGLNLENLHDLWKHLNDIRRMTGGYVVHQMDERTTGRNETYPTSQHSFGMKQHAVEVSAAGQPALLDYIAAGETVSSRTFQFSTSNAENAVLDSFSLEDLMTDVQAPIGGILDHYEFTSFDAEVILRIPTLPFHQGVLVMYADIGNNLDTTSIYSGVRNHPHVMGYINQTTEMRLEIPWLQRSRVRRGLPSTQIKVVVYNVLRTGSGVSSNLDITVAWRMKNPEFKTRRLAVTSVNNVTNQMDDFSAPVDTASMAEEATKAIEGQQACGESFMAPLKFRDYFKKRGMHSGRNVNTAVGAYAYKTRIPHCLPPDLLRLSQISMLWEGSLDRTIFVPCGANTRGMRVTIGGDYQSNFDAASQQFGVASWVNNDAIIDQGDATYTFQSVVNLAIDNTHEVTTPYYGVFPLNTTNLDTAGTSNQSEFVAALPTDLILYSDGTEARTFQVGIFAGPGEDFKMHVLRAPPTLLRNDAGWEPVTLLERQGTGASTRVSLNDFAKVIDPLISHAQHARVRREVSGELTDDDVKALLSTTPHGWLLRENIPQDLPGGIDHQGGVLSRQSDEITPQSADLDNIYACCVTGPVELAMDVDSEDEALATSNVFACCVKGGTKVHLTSHAPPPLPIIEPAVELVHQMDAKPYPIRVQRKDKNWSSILNEVNLAFKNKGVLPSMKWTCVGVDPYVTVLEYSLTGVKGKKFVVKATKPTKQEARHDCALQIITKLVAMHNVDSEVLTEDGEDTVDGITANEREEAFSRVRSFLTRKVQHQDGNSLLARFFSILKGMLSGGVNMLATVMEFLRGGVEKVTAAITATVTAGALHGAAQGVSDWMQEQKVLEWILRILRAFFAVSWLAKKVNLTFNGHYSYTLLLSDFALLFSTDVGEDVIDLCKKFIASVTSLQHQAKEAKDEIISMVISTAAAILFGSVGVSNSIRDSAVRSVSIRLLGESTRDTYKLLRSGVTYLIDYFFMGDQEKRQRLELAEMEDQVTLLSLQFYTMKEKGLFSGSVLHDQTRTFALDNPLAVLTRCRNLATIIKQKSVGVHISSPIMRFADEVIETWKQYVKNQHISSSRGEPVGVLFRGAAGVGKSLLTTTLLPELVLSKLGIVTEREQVRSNTYAMPNNPDQAYMDGYWGQPWVVYDDLGSVRDSKDFSAMINLISSSVAVVNMADLADKGQLFVSPFVCATTNLTSVRGRTEIACPDAIMRRFPHAYELSVADAYTTAEGRLDTSKFLDDYSTIDDEEAEMSFLDRVFKCRKANMITGGTGTDKPFSQVVDDIVQDYARRTNFTASMNTNRQRIKIKVVNQDGGNIEVEEEYTDAPAEVNNSNETQAAAEEVPDVFDFGDYQVDLSDFFERQLHGTQAEMKAAIDTQYQCAPVGIKAYWKNASPERIGRTALSIMSNWDFRSRGELMRTLRRPMTPEQAAAVVFVMWGRIHTIRGYMSFGWLRGMKETFETDFFDHLQFAHVVGVVPSLKEDPIASQVKAVQTYVYTWISNDVRERDKWVGLKLAYVTGIINKVAVRNYLSIIVYGGFYFMVYKLIRYVIGIMCARDVEEQAYVHEVRNKAPRLKLPVTTGSGATEVQMDNQRLASNVLRFSLGADPDYSSGSVLAYNQNYIIMPLHYVDAILKDKGCFTLSMPTWLEDSEPWHQTYALGYYTKIRSWQGPLDAVLVRVPSPLGNIRTLERSLISSKEFYDMASGLSVGITLKGSYAGGEDNPAVMKSYCRSCAPGSDGTVYMACKMRHETIKGDCGIPYVDGRGRCLGIHVNYDPVRQYAGFAAFSKENVMDAIAILEKNVGETIHVDFEPEVQIRCKPDSWVSNDLGFECLGKMIGKDGNEVTHYTPYKTCFRKSEIADQELWSDNHQPAVQNQHMLMTQSQKYQFQRPILAVMELESNFALTYYAKVLEAFPDRKTGMVSDHEILNGNEDGMQGMKRDSSAGFWSKISRQKKDLIDVEYAEDGKAVYTLSEEAHNKLHPTYGKSFVQYLTEKETLMREGIRDPGNLWTTSLKDELRPIGKATRVFECTPLDSSWLCKKAFGRFATWYRTHGGHVLGHAIGLDKERYWKVIYQRLTQFGDGNCVDMDYSKFDSTIPPSYFEFLRRFVELYYHDSTVEDRRLRASLLHEMQFTLQCVGGFICISQKGNKSGTWLTDLFNSVANNWIIMIAFYRVCFEETQTIPTTQLWADNVVLYTLGDDLIMSVHPQIQSWFNPENIGKVLTISGFNVTAADKTALTKEFRSIKDVQFLKSHFHEEDDIVWSPMPEVVSFKELNWIKRANQDNVSVKLARIQDAMKFMAWRGKESYQRLYGQIMQHLDRDPHLALEIPEFDTYENICRDIWQKQSEVEDWNVMANFDYNSVRQTIVTKRQILPNRN